MIESDVDLMLISKHTISEINTQFVIGEKNDGEAFIVQDVNRTGLIENKVTL